MNKLCKRIIFVIIILILIISINTESLAWSGVIEDGQSFISTGESEGSPINSGGLRSASSYIYNILLVAGIVIAVIIASILGIQFMLGGAEGQAKVKEMMLPYIVGCIIVFGGFGFWKIALKIGKELDKIGNEEEVSIIDLNINLEIADYSNNQKDIELY